MDIAKGVEGCFLYNPFEKTYFFRIYDTDGPNFQDFSVEDKEISVVLEGKWVSLYEYSEKQSTLNFSSCALGRPTKANEKPTEDVKGWFYKSEDDYWFRTEDGQKFKVGSEEIFVTIDDNISLNEINREENDDDE